MYHQSISGYPRRRVTTLASLGATILLAFVVRMLGSIDFIPILGDWAKQIIEQIQTNGPQ